jgi:hypothetical protein
MRSIQTHPLSNRRANKLIDWLEGRGSAPSRRADLAPFERLHEALLAGSDAEFIPPRGNVRAGAIKYWTGSGRDRRQLAELNLSRGRLTFSRSTVERTRGPAIDFLEFAPDHRPSRRGNTVRVPPIGPRHEALSTVVKRTLAALST